MIDSIASAYSPPFRVVAKYFVTAIFAFVAFNLMLVLNYNDIGGHHFQPKLLSITHIATLGFITMTIFGAMIQLVPVVLEVKLFSSILAEIQYWIFTTGIVLLVYKFWNFGSAISFTLPAIILNISFLLFSINIVVSMFRVKRWNIIGTHLASAIFWLLVTGIGALLLTLNLDRPYIKIDHLQYLKLHVITAFVGWVGMVVMGVSYKLIPMFSLSYGYKITLAKWAFGLANFGLLGLNWIMHYAQTGIYTLFFGLIILIGISFYLIQISQIFRKRLRRKLDIGLQWTVASFVILTVITLLNYSFLVVDYESIRSLTIVYGFLILVGFASVLIIGQMYKIIPFLVWYHKYSSKVGVENVPMLKDMFNESLANFQYYLMILGTFLSVLGIGLHLSLLKLIGFSVLAVNSLIFLLNMYKIFTS